MKKWIVAIKAVMCSTNSNHPRDREMVEKDLMFEVEAETSTEASLELSGAISRLLKSERREIARAQSCEHGTLGCRGKGEKHWCAHE